MAYVLGKRTHNIIQNIKRHRPALTTISLLCECHAGRTRTEPETIHGTWEQYAMRP